MSKKEDKWLFILVLIIGLFGIIMIYSASYIWADYKFHDSYKYLKSQSIFYIIGIILMIVLKHIDAKIYYKKANLIILGCFLLLLLVLIPGIGQIRNGSRSWFGIGGLGIQPSEFSKLGLIIFTSKYLANNNRIIKDIKKGLLPIFLVIGLFFILIMLEPDFGTAMVIIITLILLIFISGVKLSFFIKIGILGLIGTGGLLGQGFLMSHQKQFYLPEPQTDFIFSIISEEFGFLGILIVTFFFGLMFYLIVRISLKQTELFKKYLSIGLGVGIIVQALLNICVVIGIIPVTGVTLPFLSYGGSSLLVSMVSMGIILNISQKNS